ncbi:23S rRNA (pseudouridine(1915)-N(3))-methyltransferase RlmH [Mechercharimyces sp. CAU 1602]|uniref:23S rRNA (pseudouridine(1915)-N(3))-methyltransferase RlmH n=1 Tax=Mechercharimyces sp. CAU 1602 TaxID=2973933 RepID=UPI002162ABCF|nr:23S rRNA (pseudouridine(1915)-N(3))-methyltransferase RlmH [Mechercharimyces sp. CAU 1602]MCS1352664.1 23S rRNA (pseudouridine(1915)-N(3))-methyltransferase RlmH [Mechercharimyces sp. CAU 1602]
MQIQLITVGKLKESYLKKAEAEYLKRLSAYSKTKVIEIAEEKLTEPPHEAVIQHIKQKEGERILKHLSPDTYHIALAIEGESLSSEKLARQLDKLSTYGNSRLNFIIGGSYGLSPEIKKVAHLKLSLSAMTFPHQLTRILLLEQIYRTFKINRGETYHK